MGNMGWFLARGFSFFFYPEDRGDTFFRNVCYLHGATSQKTAFFMLNPGSKFHIGLYCK
jgi:hypothetical protein